jgi:CDP-paratose 2-epimerase
MKTIIVTGCGGLIGRETTEFFLKQGFRVIGIDNNMRKYFFGEDGSIQNNIDTLIANPNGEFVLYQVDIRNYLDLSQIFSKYSSDIESIIHTAAQPSHDWAAKEVFTDFSINATATINLLDLTKQYCPKASFIFTSTNKVYGDNPNFLDLEELDTRYELPLSSPYYNGLSETFSIDHTKHSLFGCSKLTADVYVQEYGKYFGLNTVVFRGGCLTGSKHKGAELHGFLNYLVKCNLEQRTYNLFGYKGKQVRDNIHSSDLVNAFWHVYNNPKSAEVYNIGGGRNSNCSILEAVEKIENITNIKMNLNYVDKNRSGDHIWWISDISKFKKDYPTWDLTYSIDGIINEIITNIN